MNTMTRLGLALVGADRLETPAPGVHPDIPVETYHRWRDSASNSRLSLLYRSPAHLRAALDAPPEETTALRTGRAVHAAVLEPREFSARYVCGPTGDRRTKKIAAEWDALIAQWGEGFVLTPTEHDACVGVKKSVLAHARAIGLISGRGDVELSLTWDDAATGVRCKARLDRHSPEIAGGAIVDVKTTRDASPRAFMRSVFDYGYHRQGAFYLDGCAALGLPAKHFVILAVEKVTPFAVAAYRLTEGALDAGRDQLYGPEVDGKRTGGLLSRYAECVRTNEWPAYGTDIIDITLPDWSWKQIEQESAA